MGDLGFQYEDPVVPDALLGYYHDGHTRVRMAPSLCWARRCGRAVSLDDVGGEAPVPRDLRITHESSVVLDDHFGRIAHLRGSEVLVLGLAQKVAARSEERRVG